MKSNRVGGLSSPSFHSHTLSLSRLVDRSHFFVLLTSSSGDDWPRRESIDSPNCFDPGRQIDLFSSLLFFHVAPRRWNGRLASNYGGTKIWRKPRPAIPQAPFNLCSLSTHPVAAAAPGIRSRMNYRPAPRHFWQIFPNLLLLLLLLLLV